MTKLFQSTRLGSMLGTSSCSALLDLLRTLHLPAFIGQAGKTQGIVQAVAGHSGLCTEDFGLLHGLGAERLPQGT